MHSKIAIAAAAVAVMWALTTPAAQELKTGTFKASDGVEIFYTLMGESGSWVVLSHGFTSSAQGNFIRPGVMKALARDHRVVAIDARNHGQSGKPNPGSAGRALDVIELMDHLKIEKAHHHGYSMGGAFAGALLVSHPQRFITVTFGGSGLRARQGMDMSKITTPIMAINGENDNPGAKAAAMKGLPTFTNVVVPGRGHMNAFGDPLYISSLTKFINEHDVK